MPALSESGDQARQQPVLRFARAVEKRAGECYALEFVHGADRKKKILVAWSPTGSGRSAAAELPLGKARLVRGEKMPLAEGKVAEIAGEVREQALHVKIDESPAYFWLEE